MRVVALVHFYPPYRLAGSETMLHTMLQALTEAGHQAFAVTTDMPESPTDWAFGGIRAFRATPSETSTKMVEDLRPDVIVTHHDHAALAIVTARRLGVPSVYIQHNTFEQNRVILSMQPDLSVFNTEWIARDWHTQLTGRWLVVHPPVWPHEHATTPGTHVTLVNLNMHKGVYIFSHLAQLFPDLPFLGVTGAHGEQITVGLSDNIQVIGQTSNMRRDVWPRTKVLLMPSAYESYGMAAVEAQASGIPVIAHPTPGLREALGDTGIFADRSHMQQWATALRRLMRQPQEWQAASAAALERSKALDPTDELKTFVKTMESLVGERMAKSTASAGLSYRPR